MGEFWERLPLEIDGVLGKEGYDLLYLALASAITPGIDSVQVDEAADTDWHNDTMGRSVFLRVICSIGRFLFQH